MRHPDDIATQEHIDDWLEEELKEKLAGMADDIYCVCGAKLEAYYNPDMKQIIINPCPSCHTCWKNLEAKS